MKERTPAEVFPPGDFLREEMDARGWTPNQLADLLDQPARMVSQIMNGKRRIGPEIALALAGAFGTGAEYWLNLESAYQLAHIRQADNQVGHGAGGE